MITEPPGPPGLPFIGNTYHYTRDPLTFMTACRRAYGDIARFQLGSFETYMLTNPDDIERVLVSEVRNYEKARIGDRAVNALLGEGLLLSEGELWKRQRQLAQPAFRMGRIQSLTDMMVEKTRQLLEYWEDGQTIDVLATMAQLTVEIIVNAMFGTDIDEATVRRVQEALDPIGTRFEPDASRVFTPGWIPTRENRRYDEALSELNGVLDELLALHGEGTDSDDLLSLLFAARERGEQTNEQVRDEMMTMLLAGHDTTALTLTYAWYLLGRHPDIESRLHDEVDAVLDGEHPTAGDLRELTYTERVIQETMRVYPPVYALFRQPKIDVRHGSYRIPAGSLLILPQWVVQRDAAYWDDPLAFDPDRWLSERAENRHSYAYFPFGAGPRHCIGKQFSLVEAKLLLATVASEFRLELITERDLDFRPSLTLHPRDPIEATVHERAG